MPPAPTPIPPAVHICQFDRSAGVVEVRNCAGPPPPVGGAPSRPPPAPAPLTVAPADTPPQVRVGLDVLPLAHFRNAVVARGLRKTSESDFSHRLPVATRRELACVLRRGAEEDVLAGD